MPQSVESLTLRVEQLERLLAYKPTPDKPKPYQYDTTLVADISTFLSEVLVPSSHEVTPTRDIFKEYLMSDYSRELVSSIVFGRVLASLYRPHYTQRRVKGVVTRCLVGYKMRKNLNAPH